MKIDQIFVYPIKSLRATSPLSAHLTYQGFQYDRRFMLINPNAKKVNMQISKYAELCLFYPELILPSEVEPGTVTVTFRPPKESEKSESQISIPLRPDTANLAMTTVDMYGSTCKAYVMPLQYNDWFSTHLGFPVQLIYVGQHRRPVLGNVSPNYIPQDARKGLFSSITSAISYYTTATTTAVDDGLGFSDVAPLLVVTTASLADIDQRLSSATDGDANLDIERFRPNLVLSGPELKPWEEDFWSELHFVPGDLRVKLTANCGRCVSLTVDFETGKFSRTGPCGTVLKKLNSYRRVDAGNKWSPVFGRYGFLMTMPEHAKLSVGDEVVVTKRNQERMTWYWPGL